MRYNMSLNNNQIHIWQLPEKDGTVDKSKEYAMVHDGRALKKVILEELYQYFSQQYKIDSTIEYFDSVMNSINKKYEPLYSSLELTLDEYEEIVYKLKREFTNNENNIRDLERDSNQLSAGIIDVTNNLNSIEDRRFKVFNSFNNYENATSDIKLKNIDARIRIDEINDSYNQSKENYDVLNASTQEAKIDIETVPETVDNALELTQTILLEEITQAYDKIINIIDHYHHPHE